MARSLSAKAKALLRRVGPGPERRPASELGGLPFAAAGTVSQWLAEALEGMFWVAEERGLGGWCSLDGLPWSMEVERLWEAWVERTARDLAARLGAQVVVGRRGETNRPLVWQSRVRSLTHLVPDIGLLWPGRSVWIDAKYKRHLQELASHRWEGLGDTAREAHRADVHQALAYASLAPEGDVDTVLAYPLLSARGQDGDVGAPFGVADVVSGRRRVRLILAGLPFGFAGPAARDAALARWAAALRLH